MAGASTSSIVVRPDNARAVARFLLRNGPVPNQVLLVADRWREAIAFKPGEERRVEVPLQPSPARAA